MTMLRCSRTSSALRRLGVMLLVLVAVPALAQEAPDDAKTCAALSNVSAPAKRQPSPLALNEPSDGSPQAGCSIISPQCRRSSRPVP
jgi:hypothetical protein